MTEWTNENLPPWWRTPDRLVNGQWVRRCSWLPIGAAAALFERGMQDGDCCAWLDRHGCCESADWNIEHVTVGVVTSCASHVGHLLDRDRDSRVWHRDHRPPARRDTTARFVALGFDSANDFLDHFERGNVLGPRASGGSVSQWAVQIAAPIPSADVNRWVDDLQKAVQQALDSQPNTTSGAALDKLASEMGIPGGRKGKP